MCVCVCVCGEREERERWREMGRDGEVERRVVCVRSLSMHMSVCTSIHVYTCISLFISFGLSEHTPPSLHLSVCLSIFPLHTLFYLSISLCFSQPLCLSICPSVSLSLEDLSLSFKGWRHLSRKKTRVRVKYMQGFGFPVLFFGTYF